MHGGWARDGFGRMGLSSLASQKLTTNLKRDAGNQLDP